VLSEYCDHACLLIHQRNSHEDDDDDGSAEEEPALDRRSLRSFTGGLITKLSSKFGHSGRRGGRRHTKANKAYSNVTSWLVKLFEVGCTCKRCDAARLKAFPGVFSCRVGFQLDESVTAEFVSEAPFEVDNKLFSPDRDMHDPFRRLTDKGKPLLLRCL